MHIRIRKRGKGYQVVAVTGHTRAGDEVRKTYTYPTRTEAETFRDQLLRKGVLPAKITLAEFAQRWLAATKPDIQKTTYAHYSYCLEKHILPELGHLKLSEITPLHIQEMLAVCRERVSAKTIGHVYAVLRRVLRQAVNWDVLASSPCAKMKAPKVPRKLPAVWTPDEARRFLDTAKSHRLYAAFYLALATGMRRGEIAGLRWQDVDLDRAILHVTRSLVHSQGGLELRQPKTPHSIRSIALSPDTVAVLREHYRKQLAERILRGMGPNREGRVFHSLHDKDIYPTHLNRYMKTLVAQAGAPPIPFHGLRHSHASYLLALGVNAKIIAERLGHADISLTLGTYAHLLPGMQAEAAATLDTLLGDNRAQTGHKSREK